MVSLDISIVAAIIIFLGLVFSLNFLLFRPLVRVQEERARRTTGTIDQTRKQLDHNSDLFNQYQATIKAGRLDGYRRQEQVRSEAMAKRAEALDQARKSAERLMQESRDSIQAQVQAAKTQLAGEAQEIARGISSTILRRSA